MPIEDRDFRERMRREEALADTLRNKGIDKHPDITAENLFFATPHVQEQEEDLQSSLQEREIAIHRAAAGGLSYRTIAKVVELSHQRVAQILNDPESIKRWEDRQAAWVRSEALELQRRRQEEQDLNDQEEPDA